VGRKVAERLGFAFKDLDDDLRAAHDLEAGELIMSLGRARFQELEAQLLRTVLASFGGVLALGGGTPSAPGVAALLAGRQVVFLDIDLETLLLRQDLLLLHPWLPPNPRAHLRQLLAERRPIYESVAIATVSTSGRVLGDIVADVLDALRAAAS